MIALIMAAGFGTRLEPLTLAVPKPMVPVAGKPCMQHNLDLLRRNGIRKAAVNVHYHPEQIMNYFSDGDKFGVNLTYSFEEKLMGTAGGVLKMAVLLGGLTETFVVLSSDALTDINLRRLVAFHKSKKALATIALSEVSEPSHFGIVSLDENDRVVSFLEKPEQSPHNLANTGIYVFEPEVLDLVPRNHPYDFGKELFPRLVLKNAPVYGYKMVEYWSDIGGLNSYIRTNQDALKGGVRLFLPGRKISSKVWTGKHCEIDPSVKLDGHVMIGEGVQIRRGAHLKDTVVGDRCVIGYDAKIGGSVIWSDSFISRGSIINKSVIGNWCRVGEAVTIGSDSILANRCQIRKGTHIPEG
ncbi:MAG TPA: NDP-sugar synthase, partial [Candidatus Omnitrophota bacterium]|nr:NDP-sugar synthase [Candidatus Omnitrophota bacterium]